MCKRCSSRGNSVCKGMELGSKSKMNLRSIDKFSITRGRCDAFQRFSILPWWWKAIVGFEAGEEEKIKLELEKGDWQLGRLFGLSLSLSKLVLIWAWVLLVLITSRKCPHPHTECVMRADGGEQCRDIGAEQERIGTELKVIPPALALLLSET